VRKGIIASCSLLLASASFTFAQAPQYTNPYPPFEAGPMWPQNYFNAGYCAVPNCPDCCGPRCWASADYLLWWFKDAPLPAPLVLSGTNDSDNPGALNAGGFPILASHGVDFSALSGMRVTVGGWLGGDSKIGIEGSGFLIPQQTRAYRVASNGTGNPVLGFRYLDPPVNGVFPEDVFQASIPPGNPFELGPFSGRLTVISNTRLWGSEANAIFCLCDGCNFHLQALAGFRYADLQESLSLQSESTAVDGGTLFFNGATINAPGTTAVIDSFQTRNQFYGGQVGLHTECCWGNFLFGATGKVALGSNHESINILGTSTLYPNPGTIVTVPTGQFAEPSNIGRRTHNEFAVMPEGEVKVGYQVTRWLTASAGYDFLYLSRVVRPGSQVDLTVDDRTNVTNGGFVPGTTGTTYPRPLFDQTDFWAQGVSFSLEFRY
jgi:Putative beta barrel porin-7 (BBP7)